MILSKILRTGTPSVLTRRCEAPGAVAKGELPSIQRSPLILDTRFGKPHKIYVESVIQKGSQIAIAGWSTAEQIYLSLAPERNGVFVEAQRHHRNDVSTALNLPEAEALGFVAVLAAPAENSPIHLKIRHSGGIQIDAGPLLISGALSSEQRKFLKGFWQADVNDLAELKLGSQEWLDKLESIPESLITPEGYMGFIEGTFTVSDGGGLTFGWAMHPDCAVVWIEDEAGSVYSLRQAFRRFRRDIAIEFRHLEWGSLDTAFILHLPKISKSPTLRLRAATENGIVTLSARDSSDELSTEPKSAAEALFSIETEEHLFAARSAVVDWKILGPIIEKRQKSIAKLTPSVSHFGPQLEKPTVSVIVPLYKRYDFMEHQILEFLRDKSLLGKSELIYVIDDPDIQDDVVLEANKLYQLYGISMTVIAGKRNRGYSGANNLGASCAGGQYLLFLNSDVIPNEPGWLDAMLDTFETEQNVGAVGARLLFPDGGIQHCGMDFLHLSRLGIWSNQHPGIGLAPELDSDEARDVPATTGACLLVPRALFEKIGGWDTGYLIGDFEDSDLCLAIREAGQRVVYQPQAMLTHLERQSFTGVGGDQFRLRMTICNAVRHQTKWLPLLTGAVPSAFDHKSREHEGTMS